MEYLPLFWFRLFCSMIRFRRMAHVCILVYVAVLVPIGLSGFQFDINTPTRFVVDQGSATDLFCVIVEHARSRIECALETIRHSVYKFAFSFHQRSCWICRAGGTYTGNTQQEHERHDAFHMKGWWRYSTRIRSKSISEPLIMWCSLADKSKFEHISWFQWDVAEKFLKCNSTIIFR